MFFFILVAGVLVESKGWVILVHFIFFSFCYQFLGRVSSKLKVHLSVTLFDINFVRQVDS